MRFKTAASSRLQRLPNEFFELAENTWTVHSTGTINTNQVCQAKNSIQTSQINSGDTITVEPGCYIWTMDHVISADESETIEIQRKTMDWAGELADLFGRANTEGIHKAIQGLRTKYNGEFDASELFKELDQIKPAEAYWTFTSPAAMIGIADGPGRHADLEEMFQLTTIDRGTPSSTISSTYAGSQSTPHPSRSTGDQ
jgi:hypothetical protein